MNIILNSIFVLKNKVLLEPGHLHINYDCSHTTITELSRCEAGSPTKPEIFITLPFREIWFPSLVYTVTVFLWFEFK